jgi:hypothetical protein
MDRRTFIGSVVGGFLALPIDAKAQQPGRIYRISWLREGKIQLPERFWDAMREFGWIEGKNVAVEARYASSVDQLPVFANHDGWNAGESGGQGRIRDDSDRVRHRCRSGRTGVRH